MVDETIRTIRETETEADNIVRTAQEKGQAIVSEAREKAERLRSDTINKAKSEAELIADRAKEAASLTEKESLGEIESSILSLKSSAGAKKSEAVSLVISELVL